MKNTFKNLVVTGILTSVFMIGATSAHAGLLISDRSSSAELQPCAQKEAGSVSFTGLLISDFTTTVSTAIAGLLISDRSGLLITDRSGLLITDRSGLLISDKSNTSTCQ